METDGIKNVGITIEGVAIKDSEAFLEGFLSEYLKGGFGRMNKTDFEYLLMYLFVSNGSFESLTNFDISLLLKIPESKVRRLKYEAELRYGDHSAAEKNLLNLLAGCRVEYTDTMVIFSIEDKFTQVLFLSELKKQLRAFGDYSFNPELVKVPKKVFADFLEKKYGVEVSEDFEDEHIKREEGESIFHYCVRTAMEKSKPMSELLSTISSCIQGLAAASTLAALVL